MEGYIYLYRKIQDSWIWSRPDYFQWFMAMIFKANYKAKKVWFGNKIEEVKRGSFITSIRKFSAELPQCSEQKLRTFLQLLVQENIIKISITAKKATHITILKYDTYQYSQHRHNTEKTQAQHSSNTEAIRSNLKNQHNTLTETAKKSTQKTIQVNSTNTTTCKDVKQIENTEAIQEQQKNNTAITQPKSELKIIKYENQQQHNKGIKEVKNKKKKEKKVANSENEKFSEYPVQLFDFFNLIKKHFPEKVIANLNSKNEKAWIDTLEKLNRIDGYSFAEIEKIIQQARNHKFWSKNFLSLTKLRKSDRDGVKYHIRFSQLTEKVSGKINDKTKDFSKEENRMSWN